MHTLNDLSVEFNWDRHRLFDRASCEAFLMICQTNPTAKVIEVTKKPKNKWRPQAMDTIELEKLGSRKLKLSAKETMTIAEKLYSNGIISYPRTETNMFSTEIDLKYGSPFLSYSFRINYMTIASFLSFYSIRIVENW